MESLNEIIDSVEKKKIYPCPFCDYSSTAVFILQEHIKKHLNAHPDLFLQCFVCSFICTKEKDMIQHYKYHSYFGEFGFQCPDCSIFFTNSIDLENHKEDHSKNTECDCTNCSYALAQISSSRIACLNKKLDELTLKYECMICNECFDIHSELERHVDNKHSYVQLYRCVFCNFVCRNMYCLKEHIPNHGGYDVYPCPFCITYCDSSLALKDHFIEHHSNIKPYHCAVCSYSTNEFQSLKIHSWSHAGQAVNGMTGPFRITAKSMRRKEENDYNFILDEEVDDDGYFMCKSLSMVPKQLDDD